jgi:5-methyltetrahydropteroyltriglutamate--homocysteine methyltransferase
MTLPPLPTTVIGSYSMPAWLARAKNEYLLRKLSHHDLDEMYDAARKAALKDQEVAGLDIVTDGELQRDNMIDYFAERMPGVQVDLGSKRLYYDFYESVVRSKLATGSLGLADEVRFLRVLDAAGKVSVSGPHALVKRIRNEHYPSEEAFALDVARVMNFELRELVRVGATHLQIDEPYYSGFPEDLPWAVRPINAAVESVERQRHAAHLLRQPVRQAVVRGELPYLFPGILEARVQAISLEFARRGEEDLHLFKEFNVPFALGSASSTSRRTTWSRPGSSPTASAGRSTCCRRARS